MLKVECESCKAPYQVDERRVPPAGLKMRCPKCGHSFVVRNPDAEPAAAPPAPPAGGPRIVKARAPSIPAFGQDDLPAVAQNDLPAPVRPAGPTVQKRAGAAAPPLANPASRARDLDLPAVAARSPNAGPPPVRQPPPPQVVQPPPRTAAPSYDFELDLPANATPRERRAPMESDLPVVSGGHAELPMAKSSFADLPRAKGPRTGPGGGADLPSAKRAAPPPPTFDDLPAPALKRSPSMVDEGGGGAFGEIDLPSVVNDLPAVAENLPSPVRDDRHLPVRKDAPPPRAPAPPPPPSSPFGAADDFGELELPRAPVAQRAPSASFAPRSRTASYAPQLAHEPFAMPPTSAGGPFGSSGASADLDSDAFGELDLPALPSGPPVADEPRDADDGLGSLPPLPPLSSAPARDARHGAGGIGYGELDLGGDAQTPGLDASPFGTEASLAAPLPEDPSRGASPEPPTAAGLAAAARATTASAEGPSPTTPRRDRPLPRVRSRSNVPALLGGLAILLLLGGGALHLTPYGVFGYHLVEDRLHAGDYARAATDAAAAARARMASDLFPESRAAADAVATARDATPRARALTAYAALAELEVELRFGRDPAKEGRAKAWLRELVDPKAELPALDVALAAQAALDGDFATARQKLDAAKIPPGDPLAEDAAFVRGEAELDARNGDAAVAAWKRALELAPSAPARAHFGLARAHFLRGDAALAEAEVAATLAASPTHGGARLLRAELTWAADRSDESAARALADLASVLDGPPRATVSNESIAEASAARGAIQLAHGRAGEARASFEAAVKLDPRNIAALVGQGEVLYADGRFTEALSRFDTAMQTDATSVAAIVGDAKTKIALERLADAKTELAAARQRAPKSMLLARWLGAAEAALGNKKEAEAQLLAAVTLSDPKDPDAIEAYGALASFLNAQGRAGEAKAKLDEARQKLPDSAPLQRALGDVAVAEGKYDEAVTHYQASLAKDPADTSTKFKLGQTYRRMTRTDDARAAFERVAAQDKDYPGLALERGLLDEQSGNMEGALASFQSALAKAPSDPDLQLRVGAAYVAVQKPDEALPMLKKVLEQRSNSAEAHHYVGRAYLLQGPLHQVEAMRDLKRAAELDPNRAEYHLYVAWAANQASPPDFSLASREIEKALAIDTLNADAYWQRGVMEHALGAIEDSLRDLRRALQLKPTRTEAYATMAEDYEEKNDAASALGAWQKATAGAASNPYWHYKYGRLLLERGKAADAVQHLGAAAVEGGRLQPRPGWIAPAEFKLAEALRKSGKKQEAIEHYNAFLSMPSALNSPDRVDALQTLRALGAPWQPSE